MFDKFHYNKQDVAKFFTVANAMDIHTRLKYFNDLFPFAQNLQANFYLSTAEQTALACNPHLIREYGSGLTYHEHLDYSFLQIVSKLGWDRSVADNWITNDRETLESGGSFFCEIATPHGKLKTYFSKKEAIYASNGKPLGLVGITVKIQQPNSGIMVVDKSKTVQLMLPDSSAIRLTFREFTFLQELLSGKSAAQIALSTALSPKTVETYFANIKVKLGCAKQREIYPLLTRNNLAKDIIEMTLPSQYPID